MLTIRAGLVCGILISQVWSIPTTGSQNATSLQGNSSLKLDPWPPVPFDIRIGSTRQPDFGLLRFDALGIEGSRQQQNALSDFISKLGLHVADQRDSSRLVGLITTDYYQDRKRLIFKLELRSDEGTSIPGHYQSTVLDKVNGLIVRHGVRQLYAHVVQGFITNGAFSLWPLIEPQSPAEEAPICVAITESYDNFLQIKTMGASVPLNLLARLSKSLDELIDITFEGLAFTDMFTGFTSFRTVGGNRYSFRLMPVRPFSQILPVLTNEDVLQALKAWKAFFLDYQGKYFRTHTFEIVSTELYGSGVAATGSFSTMEDNLEANATVPMGESSFAGNVSFGPSVVPSTTSGDAIFQRRGLRFRT